MDSYIWIGLAWAAAFVVSAVPAFMPPLWLVLTAFRTGADLPLLPVTIGAAVSGTFGRLALAGASNQLRHRLPLGTQRDVRALGHWFARRNRVKWLFVAGYCSGPFPGSVLFIAAGAGKIRLAPLAVTYALCRMASDTFWVWTASRIVTTAQDVFTGSYLDWKAVLAELAGAVSILVLFKLPWARWLDDEE